MDLIAGNPKAISIFLLVAGVALIIVPTLMRWALAVVMIALGLVGLFPDLIPHGTPPPSQ